MNFRAIATIYHAEMARTGRTLMQSVLAPVISTSLYFVVFGAAIGSRIEEIDGVGYGAFIVPGLVMMMILMQSVSNAAIGIYFPQIHRHGLRDPLRARLGLRDRHRLCRGGGDQIAHPRRSGAGHGGLLRAAGGTASAGDAGLPGADLGDLLAVRLHHRHLGGQFRTAEHRADADRHPPLTFLGGSFYSISVLPPFWQTVTLFNPVVYLISGFRWSFYGVSDVDVGISLVAILGFFLACLAIAWWMFRTGYRLKN